MSGSVRFMLYAGQKKREKVWAYLYRLAEAASTGDSATSKSVTKGKRPLYTLEVVVTSEALTKGNIHERT